mmetsp:Transcript_11199/g.29850  ORF Transcript_11199/g.29850 Transcript_11199/m.29850 type:complete len:251 (-) Transcript_11199:269-1021(-)
MFAAMGMRAALIIVGGCLLQSSLVDGLQEAAASRKKQVARGRTSWTGGVRHHRGAHGMDGDGQELVEAQGSKLPDGDITCYHYKLAEDGSTTQCADGADGADDADGADAAPANGLHDADGTDEPAGRDRPANAYGTHGHGPGRHRRLRGGARLRGGRRQDRRKRRRATRAPHRGGARRPDCRPNGRSEGRGERCPKNGGVRRLPWHLFAVRLRPGIRLRCLARSAARQLHRPEKRHRIGPGGGRRHSLQD